MIEILNRSPNHSICVERTGHGRDLISPGERFSFSFEETPGVRHQRTDARVFCTELVGFQIENLSERDLLWKEGGNTWTIAPTETLVLATGPFTAELTQGDFPR